MKERIPLRTKATQPEVIIKARPHRSRKVIFTELIAEALFWGESVGLSGYQMASLLAGFNGKDSRTHE